MTSRFTELAVDCHDPERLAAFWCEVLDFKVIDRSEGKVEIGSWVPTVEDVRARQMPATLLFIQVPEMADPEGNEFCVLRTLAPQN
ncbi:VOC family protein [Streptomyces flavovariabilis]|uniref:VOC family protein n=1 Tax=Streptomyces flavovariabilis TaxID=284031 RepID=UPI00099D369A|nr:VOC family protein [Streptomyces flavovariabilis]